MTTYPFPIEDKGNREPEWQAVEPSSGHEAMMRTVEWDPITNEVRVTGPKIEKPRSRRARHERPVP